MSKVLVCRLVFLVCAVAPRVMGTPALERLPAEANLPALRLAIEDLIHTFGDRYSHGKDLRARLDALEARGVKINAGLARGRKRAAEEAAQFVEEVRAFRREALLANPLLNSQPMLLVIRKQYRPDHHNTATIFQKGEINEGSFEGGAALKILDWARGGEAVTLVEAPEGKIRDPEVSFDGTRILFSMRKNRDDGYHLYECNADGSGLRQLTRAEVVSDIDPLYLPDGDIVFSSTREPKYCMCNRHIMANLFRMEADGANIHQIGKSTLFEGHGSLMADGRILYYRWEYVDRNFGDAQGLWTVNPDGTNHAVYWGNNTNSPGAVIDARIIPGTERVICTFSSCHDRPWGALAIVDRRLGLDGRAPVIRTWPANAVELVGQGDFDTYKQVMPKYEDPYPLSDKYFLCSRMIGKGETMGIYLIDVFGNEAQVHAEDPGCYDPMPLGPRPRPGVIPARRDFRNASGAFYVVDVYRGTHLEGVPRGAAKYLRVVESPEKRFWTHPAWNGQGQEAPAMNWHDFCNKRILGEAPIEPDGSAYFEAPSGAFVFFQLLDENRMMIQSMRSGAIVQSGERTGCVGCHEERRSAPPPSAAPPLALQRPPSPMNGWYGPARLFNYLEEVQPVFDRNCVRCHDYGKRAGEALVLARDRDLVFNASYNELWRKKFITAVGAGPAAIQPAYSWGSHASQLVKTLREKHQDIILDAESFDRIATWIDLNAPYYPEYASAFPDNLAGRAPLDFAQVARLAELTGVRFADLADWSKNQGPQVSFDRPELSPCLVALLEEDKRREALQIIRAGQALLKERPDVDLAGFRLEGADAAREATYLFRAREEERNRQALCRGDKVYDP